MDIQTKGKTRDDALGNVMESMPDSEALMLGFLILSLQPDQPMSTDMPRDSAELRVRILRGTSYEQWASRPRQAPDWGEFWRAYTSLEAPAAHIGEDGPCIPEYPLAEHYNVNRCDLSRLAESLWHGVNQLGSGTG